MIHFTKPPATDPAAQMTSQALPTLQRIEAAALALADAVVEDEGLIDELACGESWVDDEGSPLNCHDVCTDSDGMCPACRVGELASAYLLARRASAPPPQSAATTSAIFPCCGASRRRRDSPRVVFLRNGTARVVCDGCLERVQNTNDAWSFCYAPEQFR